MVPEMGLEPICQRHSILSRTRIPIPPLGLVIWRHLPDLNWCTRFCRPLRNHSAKAPPKSIISYLEIDGKLFGAQDLDIERTTEVFLDKAFELVQGGSEIRVVL